MSKAERFRPPNWLPVGGILNLYDDDPYEGKNFGDRLKYEFSHRVLYPALVGFQKREYPHSPNVHAIHSIIKVAGSGNGGLFQSCTAPKTVTAETELLRCCKYRVFEYRGLRHFSAVQWAAFKQVQAKLEGTAYDYAQLVGILLKQALGYLPKPLSSWNPFIELSKKQKVCSVHCATLLTAAYKTLPNPKPCERPSGNKYIEWLCPADVEHLMDNLVEDVPVPLYNLVWEHLPE
jgi:hypothetical protein